MPISDYSNFGFASNLRSLTSLSIKSSSLTTRVTQFTSALTEDLLTERSPYVNNVVSRGTIQTTGGGIIQLQSQTGGTNIITYNPTTGTVTISGNVLSNQTLNLGTIINTTLTGSSFQTGTTTINGLISGGTFSGGTFNNGKIGTSLMVGGTINTVNMESPILLVNAGSGNLTTNGEIGLQTYSGSAILVARIAGVTYRFLSGGTFVP